MQLFLHIYNLLIFVFKIYRIIKITLLYVTDMTSFKYTN